MIYLSIYLSDIPCHTLGKYNTFRNLYFQENWYKDYPWLHYDKDVKSLLCYICYIAYIKSINKGIERTFISSGFKNCKKAIEKFNNQTNHVHILITLNVFKV